MRHPSRPYRHMPFPEISKCSQRTIDGSSDGVGDGSSDGPFDGSCVGVADGVIEGAKLGSGVEGCKKNVIHVPMRACMRARMWCACVHAGRRGYAWRASIACVECVACERASVRAPRGCTLGCDGSRVGTSDGASVGRIVGRMVGPSECTGCVGRVGVHTNKLSP